MVKSNKTQSDKNVRTVDLVVYGSEKRGILNQRRFKTALWAVCYKSLLVNPLEDLKRQCRFKSSRV